MYAIRSYYGLDQRIEKAVDEIRQQFAGHQIQVIEEGGGNVVVKVEYSSLNYKDGLAVTGKGKIVRRFPRNNFV